jgi:subtilisin family serine protease
MNDGYGATGCNWHGTHVAGTVGGKTAGVAKKVRLHSVRVLDCNASGEVSGAVAGIDWVIANRISPAVINLSIQTAGVGVLTDAVERAVAAGITVVVAAGNSGDNACNYSPSNAPNAITVGSLSLDDGFNVYSNFGSCIDIAAPGQWIASASYADDVSFQYGTGTSMAAPHVAGAAALYLESNPTALPASVTSAILAKAMVGLMPTVPAGTPNLVLRTF